MSHRDQNDFRGNAASDLLDESERHRYSRQIQLPELGESGQLKLKAARVLVIGAGGLGSPAALYLAGAGIGNLGLVDGDTVEISNLQRQILHITDAIGKAKVESARASLSRLNPCCRVTAHRFQFDEYTGPDLIDEYDFVLDCSDNFKTKFLINDLCVASSVPFSHAGVLSFSGQTMTVIPRRSSCYRCIFEYEPEPGTSYSRSRSGIFGFVPGIIGSIQAAETVKYLAEIGTLLTDRLLTLDARNMSFRTIALKPNSNCPACSGNF